MHSHRELASHPIFNIISSQLPTEKRALLSYERAKTIALAYQLSQHDIQHLTKKYWSMHMDPILVLDGAATTLLTIQLNLVCGTLAMYVDDRPDLQQTLNDLLQYAVIGQFCLTEVDHGLDAFNLETEARLMSDGQGFILHTPHPGAAKFMPPTVPCGLPCIAIVFARLKHGSEDLGVKPFLVKLNDGSVMCPGVTSRLLPPRGGVHPINHSITSFDRVRLPMTALLTPFELASSGSKLASEPDPTSRRLDFLMSIWRVAVGSLSLALVPIHAISVASFILTRYSQRRTTTSGGSPRPLIYFRTQHAPILRALSRFFVLKAFADRVTKLFSDPEIDVRVRHGLAAVMKVLSVQHVQEANIELSERCGAQGLFEHNQIYAFHGEVRGIAIAEGDLLGLSIRLATELLLGRYELPLPYDPRSPFALHEAGLFNQYRDVMAKMTNHREDAFNEHILPRCQELIGIIGLRMAYESALIAGLDSTVTELYLVSGMRQHAAWYSENLGIRSENLFERERLAIGAALPRLDQWLENTNVEQYARAPILSEKEWRAFTDDLQLFDSRSNLVMEKSRQRGLGGSGESVYARL